MFLESSESGVHLFPIYDLKTLHVNETKNLERKGGAFSKYLPLSIIKKASQRNQISHLNITTVPHFLQSLHFNPFNYINISSIHTPFFNFQAQPTLLLHLLLASACISLAAMDHHLPTPILDQESPRLLQTISEHGGYAYVGMVSQAAAGDIRAAEAAREMAWEQLHSGPWHSVLPVWRDAYSMACLHVAKYHYQNGDRSEALRVLDMGLIMGGSLLRNDFDSAIQTLTPENSETAVSSQQNNKFVSDKFDKAEALRVLPVRSLCRKGVVRKSGLSLEKFLQDYFLSGCPVIITDCMGHWPARVKWNDIDYLKRVAGDRTVPVEVITHSLYLFLSFNWIYINIIYMID